MSKRTHIREFRRAGRHQRIRKHLSGTQDRPRLFVHRSLKNFYAQIVDDNAGKVICGMSTLHKDVRKLVKYGGNTEAARILGENIAALALSKGIKKVCFDRGGYYYHGRVKAFAEAARNGGCEF